MPELPEIETVVRGLRASLVGERLTGVELRRPSVFRGPDWSAIEGGRVLGVERGGKYLVLTIAAATPWQLMFHLGMSGQLVLGPRARPLAPHTHARIQFGERELRFRDPRRFGRIALAAAPTGGGFAPELGIPSGLEPLAVGAEPFVALFHRRQAPIKSALLNQSLLRGLGNIYADESLHRAGIDPRARRLSRPRLLRLREAVRAVLREAIAAGGSSIADYRDSHGEPGWFHLRHRVYGRTGLLCPRCHSSIRRIVLAGRSSHFCPHCQRR